jgi:hypothetical protein
MIREQVYARDYPTDTMKYGFLNMFKAFLSIPIMLVDNGLHEAYERGHINVFRLLLRQSADIHRQCTETPTGSATMWRSGASAWFDPDGPTYG